MICYTYIRNSQHILDSVPDQNLPDLFTSIVKASFQEKLEVLDAVELPDRFKAAHPLLLRQIEVVHMCTYVYAHVHMCMCTHVECACVSQFNRSIDMALIHEGIGFY